MTPTTTLTYLFDPLCGWCYGASPVIATLADAQGVTLAMAPTGLFSGDGARPMDDRFAAYAWSDDQRIARLTGQRFTELYRTRVLADRRRMVDSVPATVALTAVSLTAPDREAEALSAIQAARYVEGRDVTAFPTLPTLAEVLTRPWSCGRRHHDRAAGRRASGREPVAHGPRPGADDRMPRQRRAGPRRR